MAACWKLRRVLAHAALAISLLGVAPRAFASADEDVATAAAAATGAPARLDKIGHIIVIYLENRSFDNLFGNFPHANGLANADAAAIQVGPDGRPYEVLPQPINTSSVPPTPDLRFPGDLPNRPFPIDKFVPLDQKTGDLVHRFYQEQAQIDGGRMDKFVLYSDAAGLAMGYYDGSKTELWRYAHDYVLADNFFHAAFGGSFLNHFWLVCACTPRYPNAPADLVARLDAKGRMIADGAVTPDGYAVNTIQSVYMPHSLKITNVRELLPPQEGFTTIGDQLSAQGISWAWYSGGYDDALAGHPAPHFEFHHQPFVYFKQFGDGTAAKRDHLKDEKEFVAGIAEEKLPSVVFWKPIGADDEHPGYADVAMGDRKVAAVIRQIHRSKLWHDSVIIVTYDENGGFWDHVPPPKIDKWGPGSRVPTIIISPFAKRGYVDHTFYDTTSILKFIERRYGLAPLSNREAWVGDLTNALSF